MLHNDFSFIKVNFVFTQINNNILQIRPLITQIKSNIGGSNAEIQCVELCLQRVLEQLGGYWGSSDNELGSIENAIIKLYQDLENIHGYIELIISDYQHLPVGYILKKALVLLEKSSDSLNDLASGLQQLSNIAYSGKSDEFNVHDTHSGDMSNYLSPPASKILIISDNIHKCNIFARRLIKMGHSIAVAHDFFNAKDISSNNQFDLILLDMIIGGVSAQNIIPHIKDHNIPILIISTMNSKEEITQCMELGVQDYIPWPFRLELLTIRINSCLQRKHEQDKNRKHTKQLNKVNSLLDYAMEVMDCGWAIFNASAELDDCNEYFIKLYPFIKSWESNFKYTRLLRYNYENNIYLDLENKWPSNATDDMLALHNKGEEREIATYDNRWLSIKEKIMDDKTIVVIHKDITSNKQLVADLMERTRRDPLTQLYNVYHFKQVLESMTDNNNGKNFILVNIDIDKLKFINDNYHHLAGDNVLKHAASTLKSFLRTNDILARTGGDEYSMILPMKDNEDSQIIKILDDISNNNKQSIKVNNETINFSFSLGYATFPNDTSDLNSLITIADQRMYDNKKSKLK